MSIMTSANESSSYRRIVSSEVLMDGKVSYELFLGTDPESGNEVYGVSVSSVLDIDRGDCSIGDITDSPQYAQELFRRIIAYIVTPSQLMAVVEDFLCEKYGG